MRLRTEDKDIMANTLNLSWKTDQHALRSGSTMAGVPDIGRDGIGKGATVKVAVGCLKV